MVGISLDQYPIIQCEEGGKEKCLKRFLVLWHPQSAKRIRSPIATTQKGLRQGQGFMVTDSLLPLVVKVRFFGPVNIKGFPEGNPSFPTIGFPPNVSLALWKCSGTRASQPYIPFIKRST
jgi:hypothetical protein